jgi:4-amino-4-deoxy-L-arabinose transferase-like glycosyltransferase
LQFGLVMIFCVLAISYSVVIPPGEGVDEIPHFDYVRYVKENRALPVQPMNREAGVRVWMGHHPPLYYALGALAVSWANFSDWDTAFRWNPHFVWQENNDANGLNVLMHYGQDSFPLQGSVLALHVTRLVTVILGAIAVYAIFGAARLLSPGDPWLAFGATALVVFNPSFVFMSSTIHHDTLLVAIFAMGAWWLMALFSQAERGSWFYVAGGLLAGAAALTKLSGLTLLAVIGLALCLKAVRDRNGGWLLRRGALTLGVACAVAGWWYARNQMLYGDPFGWRMFLTIHSHMVRSGGYSWWLFTHDFLAQVGRTFWGAFGYMHITFPELTRFIWYVVALSIVGLVLALVRKQVDLKRQWAEWVVAISLLVALFASFVRFSMATVGAGHGRYLFPAAFTIGIVIMVGLRGFTPRRLQPVLALVIAGAMLAYAIWLPVTHVLPKYAPPEMIAATELPERARAVNLALGQGMQLTGYLLEEDRIIPGQSLPVTLYWQATGDPTTRQDPKAKLELVDENGNIPFSQIVWPVPSLSPKVWPAEKLMVSRTALYVPPDWPTDKMTLTLTPILQEQDTGLGRQIVTELVTTGSVSQVDGTNIPNPGQDVFASEIKLRGHSTGKSVFAPGAVVPLDLYWEVLRSPTADYTVFVHLLNEAGEQVSGFDRPAGGGTLPTSTWQIGQILRDSYPLAIPETLPSGKYSVRVGMYTWPSLARLPITAGQDSIGDSIDLGYIEVVR